ncbi:hypothetical protein JCM10450v2_006826 [Rhodotorula kratochvilovae]
MATLTASLTCPGSLFQVLKDHEILISSSSSTATDKPPPLLWLSNELLDEIFRLAYEDEPAHRPICRRLHPIQQKHLYRRVHLSSLDQLKTFCQVVERHSVIRRAVGRLEFAPRTIPWLEIVSRQDFVEALGNLPHIEHLLLLGPPRHLVDAFLASEGLSTALARLKRVEIEPSVEHSAMSNPGEADWLRRLAAYPALEHLSLRAYAHTDLNLSVVSNPPAFPRLTSLELRGFRFTTWNLPDLSSVFPALVNLDLSNSAEEPNFDAVLARAPEGLRTLVLRTTADEYSEWQGPLLETDRLARFKQLEQLEVGAFAFMDRFLLQLAALPLLRHIVFRPGASATDDFLLALLMMHRPPSLSRLTLDHASPGRMGPSYEDNGLKWDEAARFTAEHALPGWETPRWPRGCTWEGQQHMLEVAYAAGLGVDAVEGTSVDAIRCSATFDKETFYGTMLVAIYDKDVTELVRRYGERRAAKLLYEWDRPLWLRVYAGTKRDQRTLEQIEAD